MVERPGMGQGFGHGTRDVRPSKEIADVDKRTTGPGLQDRPDLSIRDPVLSSGPGLKGTPFEQPFQIEALDPLSSSKRWRMIEVVVVLPLVPVTPMSRRLRAGSP